jgi:AP2-associated kinase
VQREAKTMAKLRGHPNILRLHAVAFAGPKGAETDGFFLLDYCVSQQLVEGWQPTPGARGAVFVVAQPVLMSSSHCTICPGACHTQLYICKVLYVLAVST